MGEKVLSDNGEPGRNQNYGLADYASDIQWRNVLTEFHYQQTKQTDQAILTISAGALTISLGLIKYFFTEMNLAILITTSWICFCLAIIVTTISLYVSRKLLLQEIDKIDNELLNQKEESNQAGTASSSAESKKKKTEKSGWAKLTTFCNWVAAITFILAWCFMIAFVVTNLNREDKTVRKDIPILMKEGGKPKPKPGKPGGGGRRIDEGYVPPRKPPKPKPEKSNK